MYKNLYMSLKSDSKLNIYIFFAIYLVLGILIFKDFGIGIEEHFQRQNGFYWLNHFLSFTNFEEIKLIASKKYQEILTTDPYLPDANFFNFYGIVFDLPLAFIETFFNLESSKIYFEIRHLIIFLIFFLSSIFFYKILNNRFNYFPSVAFGTVMYVISPRIFGDSFYNNKDLLFLSLLVFSIYYAFKLFDKFNYKNLFYFCLFAALSTSSRIFGLYLPFAIIIFLFFEFLSEKISFKVFLSRTSKLLFIYFLFLYFHYPYIWELNIFQLKNWLSSFFYFMDYRMLFNGEYYHIKYLPRLYLPIWIFLTTPIYIIFIFLFGLFFLSKRLVKRVLNIKNKIILSNDFWTSNNEKKDLLIILSFFLFFIYVIFFNVFMVSGWRYFYFLNIFIIYIFSFGIYKLRLTTKKKINHKIFILINLIFTISITIDLYRYHPYQSLYFNGFLNSENSKKFQIDTPSLSRADALRFILSDNDKDQIFVANTSWTPFHNGKDLLNEKDKKRLIFIGQELKQADYIYTNNIYLHDQKLNNKNSIPSNFNKIKEFKIKDIEIYSIYKRD